MHAAVMQKIRNCSVSVGTQMSAASNAARLIEGCHSLVLFKSLKARFYIFGPSFARPQMQMKLHRPKPKMSVINTSPLLTFNEKLKIFLLHLNRKKIFLAKVRIREANKFDLFKTWVISLNISYQKCKKYCHDQLVSTYAVNCCVNMIKYAAQIVFQNSLFVVPIKILSSNQIMVSWNEGSGKTSYDGLANKKCSFHKNDFILHH